MAVDLEQKFNELTRKIDDLAGPMAQKVEELSNEIRERGGPNSEGAQKFEALKTEVESMRAAQDEIRETLNDRAKVGGAPATGSLGSAREHRTSHGRMFTQSDAYKQARSQGSFRSDYAKVPAFMRGLGVGPSEKRWVTSDPTGIGGAGGLIEPERFPGLQADPRRTFVIRDLLDVVSVESPQIQIMRRYGYYNLYTTLTAAAAAAQANITVESTSGMFVGQRLTVNNGTNAETKIIQAINAATRVVTFTTNLANSYAVGNSVTSDQLAGTPHGARKPQSNLDFEEEIVNTITLAHWIPVHRQTLDDVPLLENLIDTELEYGYMLAEEDQILRGVGGGSNIPGLLNNTMIQHQGVRAGNDPHGNAWTQLDWIRMAITKSVIANVPVNGIVLNPLDWQDIELLKDANGNYLYVAINAGRESRVWQIPVVQTTAMPAGRFLTGSFGMGAKLYVREEGNLRFAEQHEDFFIRNAVLFLYEGRIGLGVPIPEAFCDGYFA